MLYLIHQPPFIVWRAWGRLQHGISQKAVVALVCPTPVCKKIRAENWCLSLQHRIQTTASSPSRLPESMCGVVFIKFFRSLHTTGRASYTAPTKGQSVHYQPAVGPPPRYTAPTKGQSAHYQPPVGSLLYCTYQRAVSTWPAGSRGHCYTVPTKGQSPHYQ